MYVQVVELVGASDFSWKDAVQQAVEEASEHIDNITGVEVYNLTASVEHGKLVGYKANVKIACADERL